MNKMVGDLTAETIEKVDNSALNKIVETRAQTREREKAELRVRQEAELAERRRLEEEEAYQRRRSQGCDCTAGRSDFILRG